MGMALHGNENVSAKWAWHAETTPLFTSESACVSARVSRDLFGVGVASRDL